MKGMRFTMEDRHNSITDITFKTENESIGSFFGVYDGHGGDTVAEFVSKNLFDNFKELELTDKNITETFIKVDNQMNQDKEVDVGTTCVTTFITKYKDYMEIICANSGDSRAILYHDGQITPLSYDQKPSNDEEKKRILESGNIVLLGRVNGSLAVSRAFGDFRYKKNQKRKHLHQINLQ